MFCSLIISKIILLSIVSFTIVFWTVSNLLLVIGKGGGMGGGILVVSNGKGGGIEIFLLGNFIYRVCL